MRLRSHLLNSLTLLQVALFVAGFVLAAPAQSSPTSTGPQLSYSAEDLVELEHAAKGRAWMLDAGRQVLGSRDSEEVRLQTSPLVEGIAQNTTPVTESNPSRSAIDLDPKLIDESPVLQRWLNKIPNVLDDIKRDPSFRTRLRLGYSQFPSTNESSGWNVGIEDVFIDRTGLTISGDYQATFNGKRKAGGADLRYYLLPLGSYVNVAPVLGYRYLETPQYTTDGLNAGFRVLLIPSRTGAADLSLTQTWVNPRGDEEVGVTTLSFGYALTKHLRLSTDVQKQNSRQKRDTRFGIVLEWMF